MAITIRRAFDPVQLPNAAATQYTATNVKFVITHATIVNTTAGAVTATVHICAVATETATNMKISAKSIAAGEAYLCPELIGSVVPGGGTIRAFASAATSLSFDVAGYEVT